MLIEIIKKNNDKISLNITHVTQIVKDVDRGGCKVYVVGDKFHYTVEDYDSVKERFDQKYNALYKL